MPNIILNKEIVKELIQTKATKYKIFEEASLLLNNKNHNLECRKNLALVSSKLNNGNASNNAANIIKGI